MTTNIYILKLEGGRFYVGKSDNPMKRYQEHLNGSGSAWTKKYKPVGIEKVIENQTDFDEDKWVKVYMNKHGMDKVRGGAYVQEYLPDFQIDALKSELWGATDKCTICGRQGHWAKDCRARKDVTGQEITYESDESEEVYMCGSCRKTFTDEDEFDSHRCNPIVTPVVKKENTVIKTLFQDTKSVSTSEPKYKFNTCYDCGMTGHLENECPYEKEWKCKYCSKKYTSHYGLDNHEKLCSKKSSKKTTTQKKTTKSSSTCYRCGREGHYERDCYARTDVDGYEISDEDDSDEYYSDD